MSTKIADLAEQLDMDVKKLKEKINELGFEVAPRARVIDKEIADLVLAEMKGGGANEAKPEGKKVKSLEASDKKAKQKTENKVNADSLEEEVLEAPKDVAEMYDEMIAQEREREIVKSQRKKTAGKEGAKKTKKDDEVATDAVAKDFIEISESISVKEFAEKTGIKIAKIIGELMKNGILANINQQIDFDTAQIIADDMGIKLKRKRGAAGAEEFMAGDISNLLKEDDAADLRPRPPVVCVMGHVDHGKTKLLDAIRETDVVSGESGGITQHIGAYQVVKKGKLITFLDTPGHEAFTSMRARGAKVTDIAILVVAADEGIKPQTVEAINHAKEAGVPIIVAINKMDKPGAAIDRVKGELSEHDLQPEDWGGKTICVPVSALKKEGIDELLDMILLTAEMEDLKANPEREAVCTVIEANLDKNLGPVATVLVNTGTLKIMNNVIVGNTFGRIKVMKDYTGKSVLKALPSTPVLIAGLQETPKSGDILQVVKDEKTAREKADEISLKTQLQAEEKLSGMSQILASVKADKILKLVIKADTKGSLEAIRQSLAKIKDEEVALKVIHAGVGKVNESDVMMAAASGGLVIGFHSDYDSPYVKKTAEREGVEVKMYTVIYDLLENIKRILSGLIEAELIEIIIGRAELRQIFLTKKKDLIVGCKVLSGKAQSKSKAHVIRQVNNEEVRVGDVEIVSLRKVDQEVKEIGEGNDCGMKLTGFMDLKEGDIFEMFKYEEKRRTLE